MSGGGQDYDSGVREEAASGPPDSGPAVGAATVQPWPAQVPGPEALTAAGDLGGAPAGLQVGVAAN